MMKTIMKKFTYENVSPVTFNKNRSSVVERKRSGTNLPIYKKPKMIESTTIHVTHKKKSLNVMEKTEKKREFEGSTSFEFHIL